MNKKFFVVAIFCLIFGMFLSQACYAKYTMNGKLEMNVYIDKTSPIIDITSNGTKESFSSSQTNIIKRASSIQIDTRDNIEIDYNEYYYNSSNNDFNGKTGTRFDNGKIFTDEGYYKIVAIDKSSNRTEIIILVDTSAPTVNVKYYKKGEATSLLKNNIETRQVAAVTNYLMSEEIIDTNSVIDNTIAEESTSQNVIDEEIIENTINNDIQNIEPIIEENSTDENINTVNEVADSQENEIFEETAFSQSQIMLMSAGGDIYVGNEAEFRNALAVQASTIHVRQSIDFTAPVYINYDVKIVRESDSNAIRYGNGGSFLVVQNGGSLVLDGIVVDTNSSGASGIVAINIENGGYVTFINSSIVDGGLGNTGILINGGGSLLLWSSEIVRCGYGINLQTNGNLFFANQEGRANNFYWNSTALFIDNFYGTCNLNEDICMHDNSEYGIFIGNSSGTINISSGTYYNNTYCVHTRNITGGSVNITGGTFYGNGWAIWCGGSINLKGGTIYNNYYGVITDGTYSGKFVMTGGNIYSNTGHAVQHQKTNDGGCTITGGSISGDIYLATSDNYINTNTSYPSFTVTPSSYSFKRKLVKTSSNAYAKNEIAKVTLTPSGSWYKYVDNQYIVVWQGGNVIVRCKDYFGNVLKQEVKNGTIGTSYSITAPVISGYDLTYTPSNIKGTYGTSDIIVDFKYDLVNIAKVNYEDVLSGVTSAKYWYNANSENFTGNGTDFKDGAIFEKYGYYKIVVVNSLGLQKEIRFTLNSNSLKR